MRSSLLVVAVALVVAAPARAATPGIVVSVANRVDPLAATRYLGVHWVREFVNWREAEPARGRFWGAYFTQLRQRVEAFRRLGVRVELVTAWSPTWASHRPELSAPPVHSRDYAKFVAHVVRAVPHVSALEVWNEADDGVFWLHGPQPARYARLLRAAYKAIKHANRHVTVLTTGMVANDYGFLRSLYRHHDRHYFDAVAVHTDTACLTAPPTFFYREPNGRIGRFAFTGYRELHALMRRHGDGRKKIWMTEIGWNTGSTAPFSCVDAGRAGQKPAGVTEGAQAQLLVMAYQCLRADPYVKVAFWFDLQDNGVGPSYADHLGLLRRNGTPKPAYAALRSVRGRVAKRRCGSRLLVKKHH